MIPSMNDENAFNDPGDIWTDVLEAQVEDMLHDIGDDETCRYDTDGDGNCPFHRRGCPTKDSVTARLAEGWEVDEHTVVPNASHLMDGGRVLDRIVEATEDAEVTEDWQERLDNAASDPEVIAAADALIALFASKITYYMAGEVVAKHRVTVIDGEPMWDGEPMFRLAAARMGCEVTVRNERNDGP
jgi:hypothetical protein